MVVQQGQKWNWNIKKINRQPGYCQKICSVPGQIVVQNVVLVNWASVKFYSCAKHTLAYFRWQQPLRMSDTILKREKPKDD